MVTIVSSTNRPGSFTFKIASYYKKALADKGLIAEIFSLMDLPDNLIVSDMYGKHSAEFAPIQELITKTEKFLFIIPEYNGSFPGVLKTFIDSCAFPESFYDKKAALTGISSGRYGNIRGIDHFTGVCHYLHLNVMPLKLHIGTIKSEIDDNGNLFKEDTLKFTNEQMDKFIKY